MKQSGRAGPTLVEATIVGLSSNGDAVARQEGGEKDGRALFVFGAAPGERVRLKVLEERPRFARAELVETLSQSPERVAPECTYFGRCGGCDWQHLHYEAQARHKQENLAHTFAPLLSAGQLAPLVQAPRPYGYRAKARLHFRREGARALLGYHARGSATIVDVSSCPVLEPSLQEALKLLRTQVIGDLTGSGSITLLLGERQVACRISCDTALDGQRTERALQKRQKVLVGVDKLFGALSLVAPGMPELRLGADGILLGAQEPAVGSGGVFSQANPEVNAKLRAQVLAWIGGEGRRVLELYAGTGNFSLSLAQGGASVTAVESDPEAVRWLKQNLQGKKGTEALQGDAAGMTKRLLDRGVRFDAALLDPPRVGAKPTLEPLVRLGPARIVYVSCDPASAARDLEQLVKSGYRCEAVVPFDMFPQSAHLEVATLLEKV